MNEEAHRRVVGDLEEEQHREAELLDIQTDDCNAASVWHVQRNSETARTEEVDCERELCHST